MVKDLLDSPRLLDSPVARTFSPAYPQGRQWSRARTAVGPVVLLLMAGWLLAAVVASVAARFREHDPPTKYVLVIDSGSSGTRMYAYNWTQAADSTIGLPVVQAIPPEAAAHLIPKKAKKGLYKRVETQPGLDQFVNDPAGLEATALQPLLSWARGVVPAAQHAHCPLFLFGTGGLRRLESHEQAALMADIRAVLSRSGFRFQDSWAKVISGTDEGLYGWLALNYQQGLLEHHAAAKAAAAAGRSSSGSSTRTTAAPVTLGVLGAPTSMGALDMGGSSLEMTFEVLPGSNGAVPAVSELQNISVAGLTFHLHTHTFKHYGLNEAYDRSVTILLEGQAMEARERQQQQQPDTHGEQPIKPVGQQDGSSMSEPTGSLHSTSPDLSVNAVLAHQQMQADLAMAAAAGLHPKPPASASTSTSTAPAFATPQETTQHGTDRNSTVIGSSSTSSSSSSSAVAEQLVQADLATAAAAGLHPEPATPAAVNSAAKGLGNQGLNLSSSSSAFLVEHHLKADLAVAAAAGLHPIKPHLHHESSADGGVMSAAANAAAGSIPIMPVAQGPRVAAAGPVAEQQAASSSPSSSGTSNDGSISTSDGPQRRIAATLLHQQQAAGADADADVVATAATAAPGNSNQPSWQPRALEGQARRQQRRQQRHLLLLQHKHLAAHELDSDEAATLGSAGHMRSNSGSKVGSVGDVGNVGSQQHKGIISARSSGLEQQQQQSLRHEQLLPGMRHLLLRDFPLSSGQPGQQQVSSTLQHDAPAQVSAAPHAGDSSNRASSSSVRPGSSEVPHDAAAAAAGAAGGPLVSPQPDSVELPVVWHPCLHEGFAAPYERIAYGGVVPQPAKVLLRGLPHWAGCMKLMDDLVNATATCQATATRPVCRLGSAQPQLQGSFLALTGFYVVYKFLEVPLDAPLGGVLDAAKQLCAQPWSWMQQHLGDNINVERYCTWGPYTVKLLRHGLQLRDQDVRVGTGDVGWPLGAALAEASKLPDMMGAKRGVAPQALAEAGNDRSATTAGAGVVQRGGDGTSTSNTATLAGGPAAAAAGPAVVGGKQLDEGISGDQEADSAWQYSQRRSWAQLMWGSHHHMHMGHVTAVFLFVVVWLSVAVYCLPNRLFYGAGPPGLASLPVHFRGLYGPGKAQHIITPAGYGRGRSSPSTTRGSGLKFMSN